jgi:hypothetical protein
MSFASGIYLFITAQGEIGHSFSGEQFEARCTTSISTGSRLVGHIGNN